ncbi:DUF485 domain-containing protein [Streptomyces sp. HUCO-GS316]|uniref:DUF485 domain-containing protein n=1 Tax=Streptomyces sp. HUCO-GS316 TaxID=2692198 RepID=UPI00136BB6D3|nr:DUF485 domain-containing protein [Streptomyces sp. HUCO-GS316]MXM65279.1 DUF485 domain-containing protein [Streptomyces sp. HUCO-GS316]
MTYADEDWYPPSPPGWQQPGTAPQGHTSRHQPYGRDPWQEPYGYTSRHDAYGHTPHHDPHETYRHGADLAALRSAYRLLRRVSTLTALGSFVVYVVLSCAAPDLMGSKIAGELSLGMVLGVMQLVVTFAAVFWYGRSAERSVDPLALVVRERGTNSGAAR